MDNLNDGNETQSSIGTPDDRAIPDTMHAVRRGGYGGPEVLELHEAPTPTPEGTQVLIDVHAASVNAMEWHLLTGSPYLVRLQGGFNKPKDPRLGADLAGTVVAIGPEVTELSPGDEVFGEAAGSYAEYAVVPERLLAKKPSGVSFEDAAAIPVAGLTALQGLRDRGGMQQGHDVLIVGASGGVGTYAVQIAKAMGATVTAVVSSRNVEQAEALGADHVIDYTAEDYLKIPSRFDVILDVPATRSLLAHRRLLKPSGTYVMVGGPKGRFLGPLPRLLRGLVLSIFGKRRMVGMLAQAKQDDLETLGTFLETGEVRSVIARRYPLSEIREAMAVQGKGRSQAKAVITI